MLAPENNFPNRPLTKSDRDMVLMGCGVDVMNPVPNPNSLREFLNITAYPTFPGPADKIIDQLAQHTIYGIRDRPLEADLSFQDGALFYAGVRNVVTGQMRMPIAPGAMVRFMVDDEDRPRFAERTEEAIVSDVESFCDLSKPLLPAMHIEGPDDEQFDYWLMGAGSMYLLEVTSKQIRTFSEEQRAALEAPETE